MINVARNTPFRTAQGGYGSEGLSGNRGLVQGNLIWDIKVAAQPWAAATLNDVQSNGVSMGPAGATSSVATASTSPSTAPSDGLAGARRPGLLLDLIPIS